MRVCFYNLFEGGIGRADPIAEILLAQRADVILLSEAHDAEVRERLARRLRRAVVADGSAAALLNPYCDILHTYHHGSLAGIVPPKAGGLLEVCLRPPSPETRNAHLSTEPSPASSDGNPTREREDDDVELHVRLPVWIVLSLDARDGTWSPERLKPRLGPRSGMWSERSPAVLAGTFDDRADVWERELAALGWQPQPLPPMAPTREPTACPDRLFVRNVRVVDARLEQDRLATYASDHYPLIVDLTADPADASASAIALR